MKLERFEELDCWKVAKELVGLIYKITSEKPFSRDFGLIDQMRRSSVSIMANIAEGFGTTSNKEFITFLGYSIRSSFEVQSHIYVAVEQKYISQEMFDKIYGKASDCINLCKGFIRYLKESGF